MLHVRRSRHSINDNDIDSESQPLTGPNESVTASVDKSTKKKCKTTPFLVLLILVLLGVICFNLFNIMNIRKSLLNMSNQSDEQQQPLVSMTTTIDTAIATNDDQTTPLSFRESPQSATINEAIRLNAEHNDFIDEAEADQNDLSDEAHVNAIQSAEEEEEIVLGGLIASGGEEGDEEEEEHLIIMSNEKEQLVSDAASNILKPEKLLDHQVTNQIQKNWNSLESNFDVNLKDQVYCLSQCGINLCCPDGKRIGADWFDIIYDNLPSRSEEDSGISEVTLLAMGTIDRLSRFNYIAERWTGPKVAAFAIPYYDQQSRMEAPNKLSLLKSLSQNWGVVKVILYYINRQTDLNGNYVKEKPLLPINTLRNLIVDQANTNYIFPVDMDFVPSIGFYDRLKNEYLPKLNQIDRAALIVPHWEILSCPGGVHIPKQFSELKEMAMDGTVQPFHAPVALVQGLPARKEGCSGHSGRWPRGVKPSKYNKWFNESNDEKTGFYRIHLDGPRFYDNYEPFVVVRRVEWNDVQLPRYAEQYVGRFLNKVAFIDSLKAFRYQFFTTLSDFLVHVPHEFINTRTKNINKHRINMRELHLEYLKWLYDIVFLPGIMPPLRPSDFDDGIEINSKDDIVLQDESYLATATDEIVY